MVMGAGRHSIANRLRQRTARQPGSARSLLEVAMGSSGTATLDEAYQRLHATGPEFDGWLSNHGPMAAEAMVRRGHADRVHRWLDVYMRRLEEFPRGSGPIGSGWQEALGDPRRIADWPAPSGGGAPGKQGGRMLGPGGRG